MWWILLASALIGFGVAELEGLVLGPVIGLVVMLAMHGFTKNAGK